MRVFVPTTDAGTVTMLFAHYPGTLYGYFFNGVTFDYKSRGGYFVTDTPEIDNLQHGHIVGDIILGGDWE